MPVLHRSPDLISPSGSIPLNNYIPVDTARHFIQLPFLPSAPSIRQPIEPYQNYIHRSRQFLGNRPLPNKRIEFSFESPLLSRSRSTIKETRKNLLQTRKGGGTIRRNREGIVGYDKGEMWIERDTGRKRENGACREYK